MTAKQRLRVLRIGFTLRNLPVMPLRWLYAYGLRKSVRERIGSVSCVDMNFDASDDQQFLQSTCEALSLIRSTSPRHFNLVQRELRYIVNGELNSIGQFDPFHRTCDVDYGRFKLEPDSADYGIRLVLYASTIVHEAVHGRLFSLGFPYSKKRRGQIERICRTEQRRFVNKWSAGRFDIDEIVSKYHPDLWHDSWHATRLKQFRDLMKRVKESANQQSNK